MSGWEDHCLPVSPGGRISLAVQVSWKANQSRCNSIVTNSFNCKVIVSVEQTSWLTNPKLKQGPGKQCQTLSIIWESSCTQSLHWAPFIWKDSGFGLFQEMTQKTGRKSASCQLALCKKAPPPYYFYEILAVRDRFKPICSRVRSAAGPRAARESSSRAAGLLAAILPIRASTALRFLAEFFWILGDFIMGFAEFLPNSGEKVPSGNSVWNIHFLILKSWNPPNSAIHSWYKTIYS